MADNRKPTQNGKHKTHTEASLHAAVNDARRWEKQTVEQKKSRFTAAPVEWPQPCDCDLNNGELHTVRCMKQYHQHTTNQSNISIVKSLQKLNSTSGSHSIEVTRSTTQIHNQQPPDIDQDTTRRRRRSQQLVRTMDSVQEQIHWVQEGMPVKARSSALVDQAKDRAQDLLHRSLQPQQPYKPFELAKQQAQNLLRAGSARLQENPRVTANTLSQDLLKNPNSRPPQSNQQNQPEDHANLSWNENFDVPKSDSKSGESASDDGSVVDSLMGATSEKSIYSTIVLASHPVKQQSETFLPDEHSSIQSEVSNSFDAVCEDDAGEGDVESQEHDEEFGNQTEGTTAPLTSQELDLIGTLQKRGQYVKSWMKDVEEWTEDEKAAHLANTINYGLHAQIADDDNTPDGRQTLEEMVNEDDDANSLYFTDPNYNSDADDCPDEWEFDYEGASEQVLEDRLIVSLALLDIKRSGNCSVQGLRDVTSLFKVVRPDLAPYDWRTTDSHLGERTGIYFERYDVCRNNCYCFPPLAENKKLLNCPLCREPRFKTGTETSFITFDYIPITHRLRLQYANPHRARLMMEYKEQILNQQGSDSGEENVLKDYWCGKLHQELKAKGILVELEDIGLVFATDGFQVFKIRVSKQCWPLLLVNLNLPPEVRYKHEEIIHLGVIPGPKDPVDFNSFLVPFAKELRQLSSGIPGVYNGHTKQYFVLKAYVCIVCGDMKAREKMMGTTGCGSYSYCSYCKCMGVVQVGKSYPYCPFTRPTNMRPKGKKSNAVSDRKRRIIATRVAHSAKYSKRRKTHRNSQANPTQSPDDSESEEANIDISEEAVPLKYDIRNLPLKTHHEYIKVIKGLLTTLDFDTAALSGVRAFSVFSLFPSIDFPRSFVPGSMHQWYNLFRHLFNWHRGKFLKKAEQEVSSVEAAIRKGTTDSVGSSEDPHSMDENDIEPIDAGFASIKSIFARVSDENEDEEEDADGRAETEAGEKSKKKEDGKEKKKGKKDGAKFLQTGDPFCVAPSEWERIGHDMDLTAKEGLIPGEFGIQIRSISAHSHEMKAEEWENWALRYSPIYLYGVMPEPYYTEFVNLVKTVRLSKQREITQQLIEEVREGICRFIQHYEEHYYQYKEERLPAMKPTIHQLAHIANSMEDTGPCFVGCELFVERTCGELARGCKSRSNIYRNISLNILRSERFNNLRFTYSLDSLKKDATTESITQIPTGVRHLEKQLEELRQRHTIEELERMSGLVTNLERQIRKEREAFMQHVKAKDIVEREVKDELRNGKKHDRIQLCSWYYDYLLKTAKARGLDSMLPGLKLSDHIHSEHVGSTGKHMSSSSSSGEITDWSELTGSPKTVNLSTHIYKLLVEADAYWWEDISMSEAKNALVVVKFPTVGFWRKGLVHPELSIASATMPRGNRNRAASMVYLASNSNNGEGDYQLAEVLYIFMIAERNTTENADQNNYSPAVQDLLDCQRPINNISDDDSDSASPQLSANDPSKVKHSRRSKNNNRPCIPSTAGYALVRIIFTDPVPNSNIRVVSKTRTTSKEQVVKLEEIKGLIGLVVSKGNLYPVIKDGPVYDLGYCFK